MSAALLQGAILIAQLFLTLAMGCALWRLIRGPRAQDRILALDTFYVNGMLLVMTLGITTGRTLYFEIALAIAMLSFVATVALSKFLLRGEVIE
jgi:multicomponent K+:H+ antiporter subunit F